MITIKMMIIKIILSPRPGLRGCWPSSPSPQPTSAWCSSTGRCLSKPRSHNLGLDNSAHQVLVHAAYFRSARLSTFPHLLLLGLLLASSSNLLHLAIDPEVCNIKSSQKPTPSSGLRLLCGLRGLSAGLCTHLLLAVCQAFQFMQ